MWKTVLVSFNEDLYEKLRGLATAQGVTIKEVCESAAHGVALGKLVPREEPRMPDGPGPLWRPRVDVRAMTPEERAGRDR